MRSEEKIKIDLSELTSEILNSVHEFVAIIDLEGGIIYLNRRAQVVGRFSNKKAAGRDLSEYWQDKGLWKAKVEQILQSRTPEAYEAEFLDSSGRSHDMKVTVVPLRNARGELIAIGVIGTDLDEIRNLRAELDNRDEELKACIRERDLFVSSILHDLRTPLISVQGFANLLVKRYTDRLDERGIQYLDRLKREADRMDRCIQDLDPGSRVGHSG